MKKKLLTKFGKAFNTDDVVASYGHTARKTCPMANSCKKNCYAHEKGRFTFPVVINKREYNRIESKKATFSQRIIEEIQKSKVNVVRIHDGGDFYSPLYAQKWKDICIKLPEVRFYAYTKSVSYFLNKNLPKNLYITYSYGGKEDHLIDPKRHRHCHIFKDVDSLKRNGYLDVSKDDSLTCFKTRNKKIGIVYHGPKSYEFCTKG